MSHKKFTLVTLLGAFLIFSLLPMFNYKVDQWRTLHGDFESSYVGLATNRTYFKALYLLENPEKYNALLMGSSRMNQIDAREFGPNTYNMAYSFGHVYVHIHNLKLLLKNGMRINEIVLGLDDFYIFKNPEEYWEDYLRRPYPDTIIDKLEFYIFYLFKEPSERDFHILFNVQLKEGVEIIVNPSIEKKILLEKSIIAGKRDDKVMKNITLLGYDSNFRTEEVLKELSAFKKLCDENNIKLTMFMHPLYYRVYMAYDQTEIEKFKRGVVEISDFHDYYDLSDYKFHPKRWKDTSHFLPSIGYDIIDDIKNKNNIVTKDNIETHLLDVRKTHANLLKYPQDGIIQFNYNFNLDYLKPLFDIQTGTYKPSKKTKYINRKENVLQVAQNNDASFILNKTKTKAKAVVLSCDIESPVNTVFKIYYKESKSQMYNEKLYVKVPLKTGRNRFNFLIPAKYVNNQLRVDIGARKGEYTIHEFIIYGN